MAFQSRRVTIAIYAGLDISDKTTHICVVDAEGAVLQRKVVASACRCAVPVRDRLGSIVMKAPISSGTTELYAYDEFGVPGSTTPARFGFTGQAWVPEAGLYYYKARMYSPTLGRFMQTDPIGYGDGLNMYRYVGNDPVNAVDYWGLQSQCGPTVPPEQCIIVPGTRKKKPAIPSEPLDDHLSPPDYNIPNIPVPDEGGGKKPQKEDCAHRGSDGQCLYRQDDDGNLELDPDYQKEVCANFDKMQRSNQQVSDVATGGAGAAAADALTGGRLPILRRLGRFTSAAGTIFFSGVTSVVTRLLGSVEKPEFCQ